MGPIQFHPLMKRARWGGTRLGTSLGKPIGPGTDYAESWECCDRSSEQSIVDGGPWNGLTLSELMQSHNAELLGQHAGLTRFPLLVKFLDASDRLSLQVHPSDDQAKTFQPGESGKTEAWVIVDCQPDSKIYVGLKPHVDRATFERCVANEALDECLHSITVASGDCYLIPAGTLHAIGEGILLAEIQQSSDITFRVSDWGRLGTDGLPRKLHLTESLECITFNAAPIRPIRPRTIASRSEGGSRRAETQSLINGEYFIMERHRGNIPFLLSTRDCCHVVSVLAGSGTLLANSESISLRAGVSSLIPASCSNVTFVPHDELVVLDTYLPLKADAKTGGDEQFARRVA